MIVTGVTRPGLNPECCRVDGNGRTSRLLMNLVLMQAGFPPVIIRRADREVYYQHLVTANEGDIRPFIRFIAECTENTLDAYLWASREYYGPPVGELTGSGGGAELPYNLVEHSLEQVGLIAAKIWEVRRDSKEVFDPGDHAVGPAAGGPGLALAQL